MALAFAHVPTMLAMIILSSLTTAGGMAVVGAERRHDGVQWWALGLLFNAAAHLLFALRGTIPDIFSIVLGNTLLMGVYLSLLAAVLQFQGRRLPRTAAVALPLLMAGCMALLADSYAARVVVAGLLLSSMNLWLLSCLLTRWKTLGGRAARAESIEHRNPALRRSLPQPPSCHQLFALGVKQLDQFTDLGIGLARDTRCVQRLDFVGRPTDGAWAQTHRLSPQALRNAQVNGGAGVARLAFCGWDAQDGGRHVGPL